MMVECKRPAVPTDFGGVKGVVGTIILMPAVVYSINILCNKSSCSIVQWPDFPALSDLLDWRAFVVYIGWLLFQAALHIVIPGQHVVGTQLTDGRRLLYNCNGLQCLSVTLVLLLTFQYLGLPVTWLYTHLFGLMTAATCVSLLAALALFVKAQGIPDSQRSSLGNTGFLWYDFYLGRELNPRLERFDLKFFCELRPGLLLWLVLNVSYVLEHYTHHQSISLPLLIGCIFDFIYVTDALLFEEAVLTTLDLTTEGFGFMLVFGDLTFVPFLFSLQTRFLAEHPQNWSMIWLIGCTFLFLLGYWIFRSSNNEKDFFKQFPVHPYFKDKLLVSGERALYVGGWWSLCRHPNYLGDLTMALAASLLCGMGNGLPWFYMIYLTATLTDRTRRVEQLCADKYGELWDMYTQRVTYRIIPGVY